MASDTDARIGALAKVKTPIGHEGVWSYRRQGAIVRPNGKELLDYGRITYANKCFELGQVIRVRDWHFTLERKNTVGRRAFPDNNDPKVFWVVAFYHDYHYNFGITIEDCADTMDAFTTTVITHFCTLLEPVVFPPDAPPAYHFPLQWRPDPSPKDDGGVTWWKPGPPGPEPCDNGTAWGSSI